MNILKFGLLLLWMVNLSWAEYFATVPFQIVPDEEFRVSIFFPKPNTSDGGKTVTTTLSDVNDLNKLAWPGSTKTTTVAKHTQTAQVIFKVPRDGLLPGTKLRVILHVDELKSKNTEIEVKAPSSSSIIETDKPTYRPGETVNYRILIVDERLKSKKNESIRVKIIDKDGTVIDVKSIPPSNQAILECKLQLPEYLLFGQYTIEMLSNTSYATAQFKVEENVLPRFDAIIKFDYDYIIFRETSTISMIEGVVEAKYSFGKGVAGMLKLTVNGDVKETAVVLSKGRYRFKIGVQTGNMYRFLVVVNAVVTEKDTGINRTVSSSLNIYNKNFDVSVVEPEPSFRQFSAGYQKFSFFAKITDPMGELRSDLSSFRINSSASYKEESVTGTVTRTTTASTIIPTTNPFRVDVELPSINISLSLVQLIVFRSDSKGDTAQTTITPKKYISSSGASVHLSLYDNNMFKTVAPTTAYSAGTNVCFELTSFGVQFEKLQYQILDNYNVRPIEIINKSGQDDGSGLAYKTTFCISIDRDHAPMFLILVYIHDAKNEEILAASLTVHVDWTSENTVRLTASPAEQLPNKDVTLTVETSPNSIVGLAGIDERVLIKGDPNKVTHDNILGFSTQYRLFDATPARNVYPFPMFDQMVRQKRDVWFPGMYNRNVAASDIIEAAGLRVITDFPMIQSASMNDNNFNPENDAVAGALPNVEEAATKSKTDSQSSVRTDFSETILWQLVEADDNGRAEVDFVCPGSITDWSISGWSLQSAKGLAVASDIKLRCFQSFFTALNLPYSIKLGEEFMLQIRVFNYKDSQLNVRVELASSAGFYRLGASNYVNNIVVPAGETGLVELDFIAKKFGTTKISVKSTAEGISDTVVRDLRVEPGGVQMKNEMARNFNSSNTGNRGTISMKDIIRDPELMVVGSLRTYIQVTGDRLGTFLANLINAIRMPMGCGEQNMQTITPSVYSGMYLRSIGRLDAKLKQKINGYISSGFFRQSTYRHPDSSYSAFGAKENSCSCFSKEDLSGSGWLTANVVKAFALAIEYDLGYASAESLSKSFDYLIGLKLDDTSVDFFRQTGRVIHTEMQGGTTDGAALTAYILTTLISSSHVFDDMDLPVRRKREISETATAVIEEGCHWLESKMKSSKETHSQYTQLIVAYGLARCGMDATAKMILERMKDSLVTGVEMKCPYNRKLQKADLGICLVSCDNCTSITQGCCPDGPCARSCKTMIKKERGGPTTTEMHGYRLLAYLFLDDYENYRSEAKEDLDWLSGAQNSNGEFKNSMDTAVAMEAMTWYAIRFPDSHNTDFTVTVRETGSSMDLTKIVFDNTNKISLTNYLVPDSSKFSSYDFTFQGSGTAYTTVVAYYHIDKEGKDKSIIKFDYDIDSNENQSSGTINFCVSAQGTDETTLGSMVMVQVGIQSGYTVGDVVFPDVKKAAARVEIDAEKLTVTLYYQTDDNALSRRCHKVPILEEIQVTNRAAAKIEAYDYYNEAEKVGPFFYKIADKQTPGTTPSCRGSNATCGSRAVSATGVLTILLAFLLTLRFYLQ